LSLTPTEYFRRQMWVSFDPDERMLAVTAETLGDDRIVWASDFPHPDAKYPGSGDEVRRHLSVLSDQAQRRIAGQNAAALYGL
ncbi:MAG: amidohydrolase family protein, partial [Chloroflexi bacterium]|nr:amidohydrolase family protein [Chloroflexota bacterium]